MIITYLNSNMEKRVYSVITTGLFPYNINRVLLKFDLSLYQPLLYTSLYLDGIVSFTIKNKTIMINFNLSRKSYDILMGNRIITNNYDYLMDNDSQYNDKNIHLKKQYILNRYCYYNGYLYSYNNNIPKLKVKIKMYKDFRLSSDITLELKIIEYIKWKESKMSHTLSYNEEDKCRENRSKYCLLSSLQRLAVYKSLYYILPDIYLLDRVFKMFCKRQHGINHDFFLNTHKNY